MKPTITIHATQAGTYSLYVTRPGRPAKERIRTGIPSLEEAQHRAEVWCGMCGYKLDKQVKSA